MHAPMKTPNCKNHLQWAREVFDDYVQVHTCVFHYLIALGDWCLSWQIYLLKAKLFGWQAFRMPEGESPNAESKREGMCNVQKAWGSHKASRKK